MEDEEVFETLVEKAKKYDVTAFTELINRIENQMYRIALLKLKDENDVYEAMQNTIISIYKNIKKLNDAKKFKPWAIKILINECFKIMKKNKLKLEKYIEFDEKIEENERNFEILESDNDLNKLLETLNQSEKISITLYYGEGYTTKEISDILNESEGTVKSRICRAKLKIKKFVEENKLYE